MRNKMLWTLPVIVLALVLGGAIKTYAGTNEGGRGWLWGGSDGPASLGWVSMNNVDANGVVVNGAVSYGVNIPVIDGPVTGYAWSENYGWISFNGFDMTGCPFGVATRSGNILTGGARILSIKNGGSNAGGWLGCVSLSGTATDGSSYGAIIDISTGKMSGYVWSDEIGWIDFSQAQVVATTVAPLPTLTFSANPLLVASGGSSTLTWTTTNATGCSASDGWNGIKAINGSETESPIMISTNFKLTCMGPGGSVEKTATVAVLSACSCSPSNANVCSGVSFISDQPTGCSPSISCTGTKSCPSSSNKWKEIIPTN
jgi:hypothetical protein